MDSQVAKLAEETLGRYDALTQELSDPNIFNDQRHYAEVAKEHSRMRRGAEISRELLEAVEAERDARELVPQAEDAEERSSTRPRRGPRRSASRSSPSRSGPSSSTVTPTTTRT